MKAGVEEARKKRKLEVRDATKISLSLISPRHDECILYSSLEEAQKRKEDAAAKKSKDLLQCDLIAGSDLAVEVIAHAQTVAMTSFHHCFMVLAL